MQNIIHKDSYGSYIYQSDIDSVVSLDLSSQSASSYIKTFFGLRIFQNLQKIDVLGNGIIDLEDLVKNVSRTNLTNLDLSKDTISNVKDISKSW